VNVRKSKLGALSIIASMLAMGSLANENIFGRSEKEPKKSNKMPLTNDESEMLASLSGKDKKKYVKQLKEKYK
jgi:hypothetical protein